MRIYDKIKGGSIIVGNDDTTCGVKAGSLLKKGSDENTGLVSPTEQKDKDNQTGTGCSC